MKSARMILMFLVVFITFSACNKVPKNPIEEEQKKVLRNKGRLVGDLAAPANMHLAKIQSVVLVKGLAETGANEPPSMYQQMVLKELQRDNEKKSKAKEEIASLSTAVVILESIVLPGARKGDRMDVEVSLPPGSEATSIEGGYVEKALMRQFYADGSLHEGDKLGICAGFVMLDPQLIEKKDPKAYKKGKIVGGAVITKSRPLWIEIKDGERTCGVAQRIEDVINNRFSYLRNGSKHKVAEAKAGAVRINLVVPDEYRDNINRYVNAICAISFFETPGELQDRISDLKTKLLDPKTSEFASLQLEAIGPNNPRVVEAIQDGLASPDDMVRFHSAIAVAYMNIAKERTNAANILAGFVQTHPKLRAAALAVLGTSLKNSFEADARLRELLVSDNTEIRYGAFRALWTRNPKDYMILGENMANRFDYHCLNCGGTPLIHVTATKRPEIVLFAKDRIFLQGNFNLDAGSRISVRSEGPEVIVKKYKSGIDEQRIVSYRLDDIIRAIVEVGGTYPDVITMLNQAKSQKLLVASLGQGIGKCELAVDALPGNPQRFKRIRDIEKLAMAELEGDTKKEEHESGRSFWKPQTWFSSSNNDKPKEEKKEESVKDNEFSDD